LSSVLSLEDFRYLLMAFNSHLKKFVWSNRIGL
jgi:hypothetical protein